jgi:hypothetical protein
MRVNHQRRNRVTFVLCRVLAGCCALALLPASSIAQKIVCTAPPANPFAQGPFNDVQQSDFLQRGFLNYYLADSIQVSETLKTNVNVDNALTAAHHVYQIMMSCNLPDGTPEQRYYLTALDRIGQSVQVDWDLVHERSLRMQQMFPGDPSGAIAEASYWRMFGWDARGHGYADKVAPDGSKLFVERLTRAEAKLEASKPYASNIATWYTLMIDTQAELGKDAERDQTFKEGVGRYADYFPLYSVYARYMLPKWGGSWTLVESVASFAASNTKDVRGNSYYALVYSEIEPNLDKRETLFTTTKVNWPHLKQGFDDLIKQRSADPWTLNRYASFACQKSDKQVYLMVRKKLANNQLMEDDWAGSATPEYCDAKFGYHS